MPSHRGRRTAGLDVHPQASQDGPHCVRTGKAHGRVRAAQADVSGGPCLPVCVCMAMSARSVCMAEASLMPVTPRGPGRVVRWGGMTPTPWGQRASSKVSGWLAAPAHRPPTGEAQVTRGKKPTRSPARPQPASVPLWCGDSGHDQPAGKDPAGVERGGPPPSQLCSSCSGVTTRGAEILPSPHPLYPRPLPFPGAWLGPAPRTPPSGCWPGHLPHLRPCGPGGPASASWTLRGARRRLLGDAMATGPEGSMCSQ